jgi:hypothetical protein
VIPDNSGKPDLAIYKHSRAGSRSLDLCLLPSFCPRKKEGIFMSDEHRLSTIESGLEACEKQLMQDPRMQNAYNAFELWEHNEQFLKQNRLLTEVDHLLAQRIGPGQYGNTNDVSQNLETSMQEQAMPYAVTETEHDIETDTSSKERIVRWLGRTAVQVAASGYEFHKHQSAHDRVAVEIDEAYRASTHLDDRMTRVFVSPRMSRKDATLEEARSEHLGDDDAIRVSWVKTLEDGSQKRVLKSLLVRDIPLSAWVAMFGDSQNIFGKTITVDDPGSALSIMKLHDQLDLETNKLPNGPVSIIEAVIPYINDIPTRRKVIEQSKKYYGDQAQMKHEAQSKAVEWLAFEKELVESLVQETTTSKIKSFVYSLQHNWSSDDVAVLKRHELPNDGYRMTRELAALLESAQQKLLAGRAALTTNTEHVLRKLGGDSSELQRLQDTERVVSQTWNDGMNHNQLLATHNRDLASKNVDGGGGGCAGSSSTEFGETKDPNNPFEQDIGSNSESKSNWKWKKGICRVKNCSTRPGQTEVGPCDVCHECQDKYDDGKDPINDKYEQDINSSASMVDLWIQKILDARTAVDEQFTTAA